MGNFVKDARIGKIAENIVLSLMNDAGFPSRFGHLTDNRWDIISQYGLHEITTEVKFDKYEQQSGNIAIEVYNPKSGHPSGLTVTRAFIWAHVLADEYPVWFTTVVSLKQYMDRTPPHKIIDVGGDKNATLYLYPSHEILVDIFVRVDNIAPSALRKWVTQQWEQQYE